MTQTYAAVIQFDAESQAYVGCVPALPGTQTCADTLGELRANLKEAIELMLEVVRTSGKTPGTDASN